MTADHIQLVIDGLKRKPEGKERFIVLTWQERDAVVAALNGLRDENRRLAGRTVGEFVKPIVDAAMGGESA